MSDGSATKGLRERLASGTEDRLGKALADLFENPLLNGALGRAADAREKATQAQELAMGALNLPSAADIERLTRRLRSVSQRLEGIEDGVHRLGRTFPGQSIDTRLGAIEEHLRTLSRAVGDIGGSPVRGKGSAPAGPAAEQPSAGRPSAVRPSAAKASAGRPSAVRPSAAKASAGRPSAVRPSAAKASAGRPSAVKPSAAKPSAAKPKRAAAASKPAARRSKPRAR